MAERSKRPSFVMPLGEQSGNLTRRGGKNVSSRAKQAREERFRALVGVLALAAFAIVFAWNWLPAWSTGGEVHVSKRMQRLAAMNERQMQVVVWPDRPGDLEAQQPSFGPQPAKPDDKASDKAPLKAAAKTPDKPADSPPRTP